MIKKFKIKKIHPLEKILDPILCVIDTFNVKKIHETVQKYILEV